MSVYSALVLSDTEITQDYLDRLDTYPVILARA